MDSYIQPLRYLSILNSTVMARHEIVTQWMGKMQFNAAVDGHTIVMDAPARSGGEENGPIPKPFILVALSGCTGMDVAALLRKANQPIAEFHMEVIGELSKLAPIEYVSIHVAYFVKADQAAKQTVIDAIDDSQEKYCGVSHMLKKAIPVTWEINFNGQQVFNNKTVEAVLN